MAKYKFIISIGVTLSSLLFFIACEKDEVIVDTPDQLFRPVLFKATNINGNSIEFSWVPIAGASYEIELSKDSLMFENELQFFSFDGETEYLVEDLWGNTRYSARIKAISKDGSVKNSEYQKITFVTGEENIFYTVSSDDIGFKTVLLKWNKSKDVSHIAVSSTGSINKVVSISEEEKSIGEKLIEGLEAGSDYTFFIHLDERKRGEVLVTTYSSLTSIEVDQTQDGTWYELDTYYFLVNAGAYVEIRNDNTVGHVLVDAIKFSREGYEDIIIDNTDPNVTALGPWSTSSSSSNRIGDNYFHDGNINKGLCSIKFFPDLPVSGSWTVYMYWYKNSGWSTTTPVTIFGGE